MRWRRVVATARVCRRRRARHIRDNVRCAVMPQHGNYGANNTATRSTQLSAECALLAVWLCGETVVTQPFAWNATIMKSGTQIVLQVGLIFSSSHLSLETGAPPSPAVACHHACHHPFVVWIAGACVSGPSLQPLALPCAFAFPCF